MEAAIAELYNSIRPYEYPFGLADTTNFSLRLSEYPTHGVGYSDIPILAGEVTQ